MPPGWASTRGRILARDHGCCLLCGAPATEVHHTVRGVETDDTLVSLCSPCHAATTDAQRAAGWLPVPCTVEAARAAVGLAARGQPGTPRAAQREEPRRGGATSPGEVGGDPGRAAPGGASSAPAQRAAGFGLFGRPLLAAGPLRTVTDG